MSTPAPPPSATDTGGGAALNSIETTLEAAEPPSCRTEWPIDDDLPDVWRNYPASIPRTTPNAGGRQGTVGVLTCTYASVEGAH
jgi:hypothetical protein